MELKEKRTKTQEKKKVEFNPFITVINIQSYKKENFCGPSDSDDKENDDDNVLKTDIFYPQKNIKKKGKRNYNDMIGEKNELKIFKEKLMFNSKSKH